MCGFFKKEHEVAWVDGLGGDLGGVGGEESIYSKHYMKTIHINLRN